jgi:hypothetical protein
MIIPWLDVEIVMFLDDFGMQTISEPQFALTRRFIQAQ